MCTYRNGPKQDPYPNIWELNPSCLLPQESEGRSITIPATHCLRARRGQGWHGLPFRFCTSITHLSPLLFQLGQEALNYKYFHAQCTPALVGPSIQQSRVTHPPHPIQLSGNTWSWLCTSMVSWLLFFQPDVFLDVGIKVC